MLFTFVGTSLVIGNIKVILNFGKGYYDSGVFEFSTARFYVKSDAEKGTGSTTRKNISKVATIGEGRNG